MKEVISYFMSKKNKKISNDIKCKQTVKTIEPIDKSNSYKNDKLKIDMCSFPIFYSVEYKDFSNYLKDEKDFTMQYRNLMNTCNALQDKTPLELINSNEYRHCHMISNEKKSFVQELIKLTIDRYNENNSGKRINIAALEEQTLSTDKLYQIGIHTGLRLFGMLDGNVFTVCLIDYHHKIHNNEHRSTFENKSNRFCPMTSKVKDKLNSKKAS